MNYSCDKIHPTSFETLIQMIGFILNDIDYSWPLTR